MINILLDVSPMNFIGIYIGVGFVALLAVVAVSLSLLAVIKKRREKNDDEHKKDE